MTLLLTTWNVRWLPIRTPKCPFSYESAGDLLFLLQLAPVVTSWRAAYSHHCFNSIRHAGGPVFLMLDGQWWDWRSWPVLAVLLSTIFILVT